MKTLNNVAYVKTTVDPGSLEKCFAEVAFVGRSNVGKSSVINAVCGQKRLAYASRMPGKTRTINVFSIGYDRWLVDLPGYGFALGPRPELETWQAMIVGYLTSRPSLRMVYMIVDAQVGPTKLDRQMALWLEEHSIPFEIVANKADKVKATAEKGQRVFVAGELGADPEQIFWVSAKKGTGITELVSAIAEQLQVTV